MVCINILEHWPDNSLSVVAFSGPLEAAVDPQESGNSGQILLSAAFLKESSVPEFISGGTLLVLCRNPGS